MAGADAGTSYWCYRCQRTVRLGRLSEGDELCCPLCYDTFLEEASGADGAGLVPAGVRAGGGHPVILQILETMSNMMQQQPVGGLEGGVGGDGGPLLAWRLPGDYFQGPGLEQLIQQLAENDPNRYGAPPAAKSAVAAMPTIQVTVDHMGTDAALCAVCKDEFEVGASVRQMPCKHIYHEECILPWLTQHNSCPVCRFELPTDDPEYDAQNGRASQLQNAESGPRLPAAPPSVEASDAPEPAGAGTGVVVAATEESSRPEAARLPAESGSRAPGNAARRMVLQSFFPLRSSSSQQQQQQQAQGSNSEGSGSETPSSARGTDTVYVCFWES